MVGIRQCSSQFLVNFPPQLDVHLHDLLVITGFDFIVFLSLVSLYLNAYLFFVKIAIIL